MYEDPTANLLAWMKVILLFAFVLLVSREFLVEPVEVHGQSMMPTFEEADRVMIAKMTRIENSDLIVFRMPAGDNYIKRVIGIPGDEVEMKDDQLYVNGEAVAEPYLQENREKALASGYRKLTGDFAAFTIPSGCYFVLGDNRLNSLDSRKIGFIREEAILGEVKLQLAPMEKIGSIR